MTLLRKLVNVLSFVAGMGLCLMALIWVLISVSGDIKSDQALGYIFSATFFLVAAPFLVFPFSVRFAKLLGVICLLVFALSMLWLAFRPSAPIERPVLAQAAAVAFVVLLFTRVGLALRRKRSGLGT